MCRYVDVLDPDVEVGGYVADVPDKVGEPAGCDVAQCGRDGEISAADTASLGAAAVSANTDSWDVVVGAGDTKSLVADVEVAVVDLVADREEANRLVTGRTGSVILNAHLI